MNPPARPALLPLAAHLALGAALAAGCAHRAAPSEAAHSPLCDAPRGDRSQLTTPAGPRELYGFGLEIAEPEICGTSAYVEVRGSGPRQFTMGAPPAPSGCLGRPAPDDPCTLVNANLFGHEVVERMREAGLEVHGMGMGACGTLGDYAAWNFGVGVMDWADADPTLALVQDRLRAWRLGGAFGVSVRPMACGVVLLEEGR